MLRLLIYKARAEDINLHLRSKIMLLRQTEKELIDQEYTNSSQFNDDLTAAIAAFRADIKIIAEEHGEIWRENSQNVKEYERIRKAARQDIINELGIVLANFK